MYSRTTNPVSSAQQTTFYSATSSQTHNLTTSASASFTSQTRTVTIGTIKDGSIETVGSLEAPCNCTVYVVPDSTFPTLHDLLQNSGAVLANVTSATTVSVNGIPFMLYNFTDVETLSSPGGYEAPPGTVATLAWIGGTVNGTTMTPLGYPTLTVGGTYILFVTDSFPSAYIPYWTNINNLAVCCNAYVTAAGAEGLFYLQDGKVFSLDNMYPQADSWLPIKVDGVPLAQFISELQSA
jgi:hypothetical protein